MSISDFLNQMGDSKNRNTPRQEGCKNITGGRRCGITSANGLNNGDEPEGWWVGYSPRNGYGAPVEGPWEDWVTLAKNILAEDERRGKK